MNNPFFGALGGGNRFMQMMQQFQQFKANFHGDPKAEVEKLLQSGRLNQQQLNAMQMQAADCCCENRAAIAQVRYDMATQACDTRNTVQTAARDIVENANANSRAIMDFLTQSKLQDLQSANQELRLAASQAAQNNYLISQLRPTPIPSYPSCNPWASGSYTGCCWAERSSDGNRGQQQAVHRASSRSRHRNFARVDQPV